MKWWPSFTRMFHGRSRIACAAQNKEIILRADATRMFHRTIKNSFGRIEWAFLDF